MIQSVLIDRNTKNGQYADILDVSEHLASGDLGSATNAIAVMVRRSPLYRETLKKLNRANGKRDAADGSE